LSFGGFGGARLGIGLQYIVAPNVQLQLRVPNVIGPISGSGHGAALMFGLDVGL